MRKRAPRPAKGSRLGHLVWGGPGLPLKKLWGQN